MTGPTPSYTVEIEDVTAPAVFARLPDALAALWEALRVLPLGGPSTRRTGTSSGRGRSIG
ncbi:hypothetical protein [Kitasatospora albolonga]|uniref:hypothetical protein n=1 Tax=Kitasatospora albolonga TaxID=68173 RepID=UPI0031E52DC3